MSDIQRYYGGTYLRFRLSPSVIKKAVEVGGQITQTAIGLDSIFTGIKLRKSIQRQQKVARALDTGKKVSYITTGIATAISELLK